MKLSHFSSDPLGIVRSKKQDTMSSSWSKPRGLWVSVDGEDDWETWCNHESYFPERLAYRHDIVLFSDANILTLTSVEALNNFFHEYKSELRYGQREIDWQDVASRFQGIIIAPYQWEYRMTHWYYGWDCASGCIWDASAIASANLCERAA